MSRVIWLWLSYPPEEPLSRIVIGIFLLISGINPNPGPDDNTTLPPYEFEPTHEPEGNTTSWLPVFVFVILGISFLGVVIFIIIWIDKIKTERKRSPRSGKATESTTGYQPLVKDKQVMHNVDHNCESEVLYINELQGFKDLKRQITHSRKGKLEKCIPLKRDNEQSIADISCLKGSCPTFSEKETCPKGTTVVNPSTQEKLLRKEPLQFSSLKVGAQIHRHASFDRKCKESTITTIEGKLEKCIPLKRDNEQSIADISCLKGSCPTFSEKETCPKGMTVVNPSTKEELLRKEPPQFSSLKIGAQIHQYPSNDELKHERCEVDRSCKEITVITIEDYPRKNNKLHPTAFIVLFSKICYKFFFLDQIEKTFRGFIHCSRRTIKGLIKQYLNNIVETKSNYKIYDVLFTLCLLLVKKHRMRSSMGRLMMLLRAIVPRTSAPCVALCIFNSVTVKNLREHKKFNEALFLVLNNINSINLDVVCTFNCQRIIDLINVLREQFVKSKDSHLLHLMLEFTQRGFIQLANDRTTLADQLKEILREHTRFYIMEKTLCLKDYKSSDGRLMKAILSVDVPACQLAIQNGADFNWCIHALFQVTRSHPSIVYNGNDVSESTFHKNQISIINHLVSLDVHEHILGQGLSFLRLSGDGRRIALLNGICSKLEKKYDNICAHSLSLKVKYGRIVENHTEKEVFMAFVDSNENIRKQTFAGRDVLFRNPLKINHEGIKVALKPSFKDHQLSDNDFVNIRETINREGKGLWEKHTNLNIISACSMRSKQNGQNIIAQPCIVLYCTCKGFIPNSEPKFPKFLQSKNGIIEVDVREGFFSLGCGKKTTDWNSPLRMGGSVGLSGRMAAGTIGPFVKLPQDRTGFLTCAHVFADLQQLQQNANNNIINVNMITVQPSEADFTCLPRGKTRHCGIVKQLMFNNSLPTGIDAALVEITHRHPERGLFAVNSEIELRKAGFTKETDPIFDTGSIIRTISADARRRPVVKFGYKTGLTIGSFELDGAQVLIKDQPFDYGGASSIVFKGMYEIRCDVNNAFRLGDSGSGVFLIDKDEKTLHCVGIAIGGTSYGSTIVEPIGPVLDVLFGSSSQSSLKQFSFPEMNEG